MEQVHPQRSKPLNRGSSTKSCEIRDPCRPPNQPAPPSARCRACHDQFRSARIAEGFLPTALARYWRWTLLPTSA
eukprot:3972540-Amphidinium_carterae.1